MSNSYLFIDGGYFNFYRIYATQRWYQFSHREENIDNDNYHWIQNDIFKDKLKKMYINTILELCKKYDITIENTYLCLDSSNIWRLEYYEKYKKNRKITDNFKPIFNFIVDEIHKELVKLYKLNIIQINRCEADDIIGTIIMNDKIINKAIIITSDMDYLQLIKHNNIELYDMKGNKLNNKSIGNHQQDLLLKILMGDKSDNIPSVFPKCGLKTGMKYINNHDLLQEKLKQNIDFENRYNLNKRLIDMTEIPIEFQQEILSYWNTIN